MRPDAGAVRPFAAERRGHRDRTSDIDCPTGRGLAVLDLASGRVTRTIALPDGTSIEGMALRDGRVVALSDTTALVCSLADGHLVTTPLPGQATAGHPG